MRESEAFRVAVRIGVSSRFAVLLVAIFAALSFGPASGGLARENAHKFDEPALTHALARGRAAKKFVCVYAVTGARAALFLKQGFSLVAVGSDSACLRVGAQETIKAARG